MAWSALWLIALTAVPAVHVLVAPYTKVEESFTIHAVHDVLRFGPSNFPLWDHRTFPGAVPRSFLPPIALGALAWPVAAAATASHLVVTPIGIQITVRLTMVLIFALCYLHLTRTLSRRYGNSTAGWFVAISLAQFHVPYYAGRTLPNFTALPFVVLGASYLLRGKHWRAVAILTAVATVVRLEVALIAVPTALNLVLHGRMSFMSALTAGMAGGFGSLAIAAPIDYFLWSPTLPHPSLPTFTPLHTLWPELSAALFNIVGGHADEWGVMPPTFYFGAVVRMLLGAFPLLVCGIVWSAIVASGSTEGGVADNKVILRCVGEVMGLLGPGTFTLIAVLSTVGHKEWRFVVYVIPIFNIIAAAAASALSNLPSRSLRGVARLGLLGLLALTAAFTVFSTWVSTHNYPGGDVWKALEVARVPPNATIHFHSYPLQTGSTLFTFLHHSNPPSLAFPPPIQPAWVYSKDESRELTTPLGAYEAGMDYVVTLFWKDFINGRKDGKPIWKVVSEIEGFNGVGRGGKWFVYVKMDRKIGVLQRL